MEAEPLNMVIGVYGFKRCMRMISLVSIYVNPELLNFKTEQFKKELFCEGKVLFHFIINE